MTTEHSTFLPLDPGRVNTMDPNELQYWCTELKCTPEELSEAIAENGEHVTEVREALANMRRRD